MTGWRAENKSKIKKQSAKLHRKNQKFKPNWSQSTTKRGKIVSKIRTNLKKQSQSPGFGRKSEALLLTQG